MLKCLSIGKYIRITMKGWKYDTFGTRVKSDQCNVMERGRRNSCTKVEGGGCKREYSLLHITV